MNVFERKIVSKDHFLLVTSFAKFIDKNKQRTIIMQWLAFQDANLLSPDSLNNVQRHFFSDRLFETNSSYSSKNVNFPLQSMLSVMNTTEYPLRRSTFLHSTVNTEYLDVPCIELWLSNLLPLFNRINF